MSRATRIRAVLILGLILGPILGLSMAGGGPLAAQTDPAAALRGALESVGCVMDRTNQQRVLGTSGLTEPQAMEALGRLIAAAEVVVEGESLRLTSGPCTGVGGDAPDPQVLADRRARLAGAVATRGCRMGPDDVTALGVDLMMSETELAGAMLDLVGRGEGRVEGAGGAEVFVLTAPPCDAAASPRPSPPVSK